MIIPATARRHGNEVLAIGAALVVAVVRLTLGEAVKVVVLVPDCAVDPAENVLLDLVRQADPHFGFSHLLANEVVERRRLDHRQLTAQRDGEVARLKPCQWLVDKQIEAAAREFLEIFREDTGCLEIEVYGLPCLESRHREGENVDLFVKQSVVPVGHAIAVPVVEPVDQRRLIK